MWFSTKNSTTHQESNVFIHSYSAEERCHATEQLLNLVESRKAQKHCILLEKFTQTETEFDVKGYLKQIQTELKIATEDYISLENVYKVTSSELQEAKDVLGTEIQKLIDSETDLSHYCQ